MKQRVPCPARTSGPRIEGAHGAERRIDADIVRDRGADDDDAAAHYRRGGDLEFARPDQWLSDIERDLAIGAEFGAGNPGPGVERNDAKIIGANENPAAAGGAFGRLVVNPVRDATAGIAVAGAPAGIDLGIVAPLLRTGPGIERDDLVERRAEYQTILDQYRRGLEFRACHQRRVAGLQIAGAKFEG